MTQGQESRALPTMTIMGLFQGVFIEKYERLFFGACIDIHPIGCHASPGMTQRRDGRLSFGMTNVQRNAPHPVPSIFSMAEKLDRVKATKTG